MQVTPVQLLQTPINSASLAPKSNSTIPTGVVNSSTISRNSPIVVTSAQNDPPPIVYERPTANASVVVSRSSEIEAPDNKPNEQSASEQTGEAIPSGGDELVRGEESDQAQNRESSTSDRSPSGLSDQQREQVAELSKIDRSVRAHEQAHKSAGGQYAGAISLSYQTGPDGKRYAIGGEVSIDLSVIPGDPQATIAKMRTVRAAATAPADPSAQDRKVAITASRIMSQAQIELSAQKLEEIRGDNAISSNDNRLSDAARGYREIIGLEAPNRATVDAFA